MLTAAKIRAAEPRDRAYKVADGQGLFLFVTPKGTRSWRLAFRYQGRHKLMTFGTFPAVSLAEARDRRDQARQQLRAGEDPSGVRRRAIAAAEAAKTAATFGELARAWHADQAPRWSTAHAADVLASLERHALPAIGALPIAEVSRAMILELLRRAEAAAPETARRLRQRISAIFELAIDEGLVSADPAATLARRLRPAADPQHQPAIVDIDELRAAIAAIEATAADSGHRIASRFLALTAVRWAAARGARWDEFQELDLGGTFVGPLRPAWRIPAARVKLAKGRKGSAAHDHIVPLSPAAVDVLRAARVRAGRSAFVFPGRAANQLLGVNALSSLYAAAGLQGRHTPHGWRAAFSTILNERRPADRLAIDMALGHIRKGHSTADRECMSKVEAAYNRSKHLRTRRLLFFVWAELLA